MGLMRTMGTGKLPPKPEVDAVIRHLKSLHKTARDAGSRSIALGLLHHPMLDALPGGREAVNAFNSRIAKEVEADAFIDTSQLLEANEWRWSSDQVHLQSQGYAEMGRSLARP